MQRFPSFIPQHSTKDRRKTSRSSFPDGPDGSRCRVEIRYPNGSTYVARLLNVSSMGMLFECVGTLPPVRIHDLLSIKVVFPKDVMWITGRVRHCHRARIGIEIVLPNTKALRSQPIRNILPSFF